MTTWQISNLYDQSLELVEGRGVAKDFEKAFALNAQAARLGHHDAILAMGWFYLNGVGVTRDVERARKWYRDSARQGEAKAMFSLGQIAFDERDFANALTWFRCAVAAGHERSLYWIGKRQKRSDEIISSSGPKESTRGKAGFEIRDIRPRHSPPHGIQ